MIDRVFIPLDGTSDTESILPWISAWNLKSATFILFHCLPSRFPNGDLVGHSRFGTQEQALEYLEGVSSMIDGKTELIVRSGFQGDRIVTAALQAEADLIVMGGCGEYGAPRILGKVTEMVARTSPLPVLLLKTPLATPVRKVRRILVPLSGETRGDENMEILRGIAKDLHSEVILLHVSDPEEGIEGSPDPAGCGAPLPLVRKVWSILKDNLSASDVRLNLIQQVWAFLKNEISARTVMTKGSFVEEILGHERSLDTDIVAVARDGTGPDQPWNSILRMANRAVLLYENSDLSATAVLPVVRDPVVRDAVIREKALPVPQG